MLKKHWVFFVTLVIFLLLLAKNPFSQRTLIPNFEPYPDTIHYVNAAQSLVRGHGLAIWREGRSLQTSVPPLYSLFLTPLFFIHNDPRVFFFTNIILALFSFLFFYLIIKKITKNQIIQSIALFLYTTNYFFYWYPSLAMAENLTLFLFMTGTLLLVRPVTKNTVLFATGISLAFYFTKYASIPLTGIYFICYLIKIYFEGKKENMRYISIALSTGVIIFLLYSYWEATTKGSTLLLTLLAPLLKSHASTVLSSGTWFSINYFHIYFPQYIKAMMGGLQLPFLWDRTPIVPIYVGTIGITGLVWGLFNKTIRLLMGSLLALLLFSILFMSTFYSVDMRYLYHAIPTLLIGFVVFWDKSFLLLKRKHKVIRVILYMFLIGIFLLYFATSAIRIKKQIMLNLKYAETPWYYISILELNRYFGHDDIREKEPVVISSMIPYYIDFFSNNNYTLLPLSLSQEFRTARKEAWGNFDYSNLINIYHKVLLSGYPLYIDNYGLGNEKPLHDDFKKIEDTFNLTLVQTGCFNACNIWKVTEKPL